MHGCLSSRDTDAPCNAYCAEGIHSDLVYLSPTTDALPVPAQLAQLRRDHGSTHGGRTKACIQCTFLDLRPAPEAPAKHVRFPKSHHFPWATIPYLVRYTVTQEGA